MQTVIINGVTYTDVPQVNIPKVGGGTASFFETSAANITSGDVLNGKTAYGASGVVTGNLTVPVISQDSTTKILSIT